ncbi:response regulator transcription factor [Pseudomonas palmensis]|uniref:response regulator transcription factor n=1 Tax=Pseudomonas palmensis TaxID=2815362 RepID=UPI0039E8BD58
METITSGTWMGKLGKGLAPRELEALLGVAQGLTAKEIARLMQVTPGTVANRIENAMFKLGVHRRAALVAEAMKRQIISPMCFVLVALIAMHSLAAGGGDPMRRDRRAPERRIAQVRVLRRAESVELHS